MEIASPEAREINEWIQGFMNTSFDASRLKFEALLEKLLSDHDKTRAADPVLSPAKIAPSSLQPDERLQTYVQKRRGTEANDPRSPRSDSRLLTATGTSR